jgi:tetrahydromethanopterin S-methyltransferase subunit B
MTAVPVKCPSCGLVFQSRMFSIENSVSITLRGNSEPCIACGAQANLINGTFHAVGEHLTVVSAAKDQSSLITELRAVLEQARDTDAAHDDVIEAISSRSPALAQFLGQFRGTKIFGALILAIIYLLSRIDVNVNIDMTIDVNQLLDRAAEIQQEVDANANT